MVRGSTLRTHEPNYPRQRSIRRGEVFKSGDVPEGTYRERVGNRFLYLSGDENSILSPNTVELAGTQFYDGFKREPFL